MAGAAVGTVGRQVMGALVVARDAAGRRPVGCQVVGDLRGGDPAG
jgi:hypothetical protein